MIKITAKMPADILGGKICLPRKARQALIGATTHAYTVGNDGVAIVSLADLVKRLAGRRAKMWKRHWPSNISAAQAIGPIKVPSQYFQITRSSG